MKNEHWLRNVVEHMQSQGAVNIRIVRGPGRVLVYGDTSKTSSMVRVAHQIRNVGTREEQEQRLGRWLGQYRHWLDWVFINQGNNEIGEYAK